MTSHDIYLRVRINQIDHTLAAPGPLDNSRFLRVPVIRIYGSSSAGKKACVHVHQVYPYFYVDYLGSLDPENVKRYIAKLSHSLNHAIAVSLRRSLHSRKSQFVHAILLVKGIQFYGFHASYSPFLKILIADPAFISRAVTIMQSGTVMRTRFKTYENHLSYILQFMCDFNLYGCGWIDLGEVWHRGPDDLNDEEAQEPLSAFKFSPYFRQSRMDLEVDVASHQILNRRLLSARNIHHTLTVPAPPLPSEPLVHSIRELWEDERQRRIAQGLDPSPELPVLPSERSRGSGGHWVAEARWWQGVIDKLEKEKDLEVQMPSRCWEKGVMTTFESVEALWEDEWKSLQSGAAETNEVGEKVYDSVAAVRCLPSDFEDQTIEIDVDETMLSSQEISDLALEEELVWDEVMDERMADGDDVDDEDGLLEEELPSRDELSDNLEGGGDVLVSEEVVSGLNDADGLNAPISDSQLRKSDPCKDSPRKRRNPFGYAWIQAAGRRDRSASEETTTPGSLTKSSASLFHSSPKASRVPATKAPENIKSPYPSISAPRMLTTRYSLREKVVLDAAQNSPSPKSNRLVQPCNETFAQLHTLTSRNASPSGQGHSDHERQSLYTQNSCLTPEEITGTNSAKMSTVHNIGEKAEGELVTFFEHDDGPPFQALQFEDNDSLELSELRERPPPSVLLGPAKSTSSLKDTPGSRHPSLRLQARNAYIYTPEPPAVSELVTTLNKTSIPDKIYRDPFYSKESDAPEQPREYAGLVFALKGGEGVSILDPWISEVGHKYFDNTAHSNLTDYTGIGGWEYGSHPPSIKEVKRWLKTSEGRPILGRRKPAAESQVEGPTQGNIYGYKITPVEQSELALRERHGMTVLSLEVFATVGAGSVPDAENDEIIAVFYSFESQNGVPVHSDHAIRYQRQVISTLSPQLTPARLRDFNIEVVNGELELLNTIIDRVNELDPDIIAGWDTQTASWGYLNARGRQFGMDIEELISRCPASRRGGGSEQWEQRQTSTFKVAGRHVLNVWRIMRVTQTLNVYTFENVAFHLLRRRIPHYGHATLTEWYNSSMPTQTSRIVRHFLDRTSMVLEMLNEAEVITQNAEFARVFGVDFFSVISRGSQFKVESFMFRIAKPESFVLLSPSKQDVGKQNAAECMPLIMEPLSAFYGSPLLVLDFQSLYPSVMIAYNYCYSTCLGRVNDFKGRNKFGVTELDYPPGLLDTLKEHLFVAPNGMIYVKPIVRKGLLAKMLTELLDTRVMVKEAMKRVKGDKALRRILDARQLSLKYICNVTYGYTSASYSGRMPAVEVADSIVQSGRETLEQAIRVIESTPRWDAKVVYGDTDSLFIYLRGKNKDQAFRVGHDIADTITSMNPAPIKLKFEKVYLPCVLIAKKRYVGFKYENPDDSVPTFDAKGIETVRRDGVPAQAKMTEACLKVLFRTQDLSKVKEYCCRSWLKLLEGKVSIQDFIFAKEVKMGIYSDRVPPPPGVTVAARRMLLDPNDEPQYGERVPYVIVRGEPNTRLVDRAVAPEELLNDRHMHLDATYYISRVLIPPLERIFNLVGANVRSWYDEMPKSIRADGLDASLLPANADNEDMDPNRITIDEHFHSHQCLVCGGLTPFGEGVCDGCYLTPESTIARLLARLRKAEMSLVQVHQVCTTCSRSAPAEPIECESLDCPWLFQRKKAENRVAWLHALADVVSELDN